ncbi:MAG: hypothetical protein AAFQ89_16400 [Cyanobacteria bacterium J06626_18]
MTSLKKGARRVSLRLEATPESIEAKLLNHIKEDPIAPSRAVMLRALRAFYLPWAMEGAMSEAELRNLAQSAIEELQFRIFQIRQRYLTDEAPGYKPPPPLNPPTNGPAIHVPASREVSIGDFHQSINPADLDDF